MRLRSGTEGLQWSHANCRCCAPESIIESYIYCGKFIRRILTYDIMQPHQLYEVYTYQLKKSVEEFFSKMGTSLQTVECLLELVPNLNIHFFMNITPVTVELLVVTVTQWNAHEPFN